MFVYLYLFSNSSTVQVSRTRSWLCFPPSKAQVSNMSPHQNLPEGSVLHTFYFIHKLNSQNENKGHQNENKGLVTIVHETYALVANVTTSEEQLSL